AVERLPRPEERRLRLEDVLLGLDDQQVDAALDQRAGLLVEDLDQAPEADVAEGGVVGRGQEAGGPDRAGHEAVGAGCLAGDLSRPAVDLDRVVREPPLVELQAAPLEGVGLEHLGAGIEHGAVDALDDVGTIEDERLMALALEATVVLLAELELLERCAHAAVE